MSAPRCWRWSPPSGPCVCGSRRAPSWQRRRRSPRVGLTPAQQEVCDGLLDLGGARPEFRADLRADLHKRLTDATADIAERLEMTGPTLWLPKTPPTGGAGGR